MDDKSQFSIFDDLGGKHKPEEKKAPTPDLSAEEVKVAIEKLRKQHDIVEKQLEHVYQVSGLTPQQIKNTLANRDNFSPQEWEAFLIQQNQFEKIFGKGTASKVGFSPTSTDPQKLKGTTNKEDKKRKGKTLGGRRGWMPM